MNGPSGISPVRSGLPVTKRWLLLEIHMQPRSILRYNSGQKESRLASFPEPSINPASPP